MFYLLKDRERVRESFIDVFPADSQIHVVYVLRILNRVVGAYVRVMEFCTRAGEEVVTIHAGDAVLSTLKKPATGECQGNR